MPSTFKIKSPSLKQPDLPANESAATACTVRPSEPHFRDNPSDAVEAVSGDSGDAAIGRAATAGDGKSACSDDDDVDTWLRAVKEVV